MIDLGREIGGEIKTPLTIQLIGDVGAGKTTLTRGIAEALGVKEPVSSPSFTIMNYYSFGEDKNLVHYDFYRISEPGIMAEDLSEAMTDPNTIVIVEWGDDPFFGEKALKIYIRNLEDGAREVEIL